MLTKIKGFFLKLGDYNSLKETRHAIELDYYVHVILYRRILSDRINFYNKEK